MIEEATLSVEVVRSDLVCEGVRRLCLRRVDGQPLPRFSAGSHVVIEIEADDRVIRNPYSLISDGDGAGAPVSTYEVAVALDRQSRGGSAWLHRHARAGACLRVGWPHNQFGLARHAKRHLLIAGGIGITPILAMARRLVLTGQACELHYAYRGERQAPLLDELRQLFRQGATHQVLCEFDGSRGRRMPIGDLFAGRPLGSHVYVCGPRSMIDDCVTHARAAGWPSSAVHVEAFGTRGGGEPFTAVLARSGLEIDVPADQSLLEALEAAGVRVDNTCRGGACGACRTSLLDGQPLHADYVLSDEERRRGDCLLPCVSRGLGRLTLDL